MVGRDCTGSDMSHALEHEVHDLTVEHVCATAVCNRFRCICNTVEKSCCIPPLHNPSTSASCRRAGCRALQLFRFQPSTVYSYTALDSMQPLHHPSAHCAPYVGAPIGDL
eukprot:7260061-Prymnesium_polylepis.1